MSKLKSNSRNEESALADARWQAFVEVLLIVALFFIAAGDPPPNVNEAHYLGRLKHYWDPTWCQGDAFMQSADTQLAFIWLFGWISRFTSLAMTAWVGRLIVWTLIAWAWQRLSWRVATRRFAPVLSAALFLIFNLQGNLAGEWVVGGVEAKCFAYAFVLFALRDVLDNRWGRAWLLLGVATAFHPLVGGWSGVLCVGVWLVDGWCEAGHSLRAMLPGFVVGGVIALVGIVPALMLTRGVPAETVAESIRIYVFDRLPHHLAPLSLPRDEATRRITAHAILLAGLFVLCWFRVAPMRRLVLFAWGAVLLAAIGFAIEFAFWNQPMLAAKFLRYYWFRMTDFAAAMAAALYIVAIVSQWWETRRKAAVALVVISTIGAGWFFGGVCLARWRNPIPPADFKIAYYPAWVDVCDWIAANTSPDDQFVTPRLNLSFKWRTGRSEVVNRKDIPQDAAGIVEWSRRVKDVYAIEIGGVTQSVDSVGTLGTERVKSLAKKYGAQYVVSDRTEMLDLPVAYRNEDYVVYRIAN